MATVNVSSVNGKGSGWYAKKGAVFRIIQALKHKKCIQTKVILPQNRATIDAICSPLLMDALAARSNPIMVCTFFWVKVSADIDESCTGGCGWECVRCPPLDEVCVACDILIIVPTLNDGPTSIRPCSLPISRHDRVTRHCAFNGVAHVLTSVPYRRFCSITLLQITK